MDFYTILGLERGAGLDEIRRAYRRLARRYHPDINPGDRQAAAVFRQVVQAFETLSDPDRKGRYDRGEAFAPADGPTAVEFQGFDFSVQTDRSRDSTFGELFADALGVRGAPGPGDRPSKGADLHTSVTIGLEEAMRSIACLLTVTRLEQCASCGGAGILTIGASRCPQCQGVGAVRSVRGHMVFSKTCPGCSGTGQQRSRLCPACAGEGITARSETLTVNVPAGIADGGRVRVPGKGHAGRRGGQPGDLYVDVQVAAHPLFHRDGNDLSIVVPVAVHEAALGAKIDVPTMDGPARLRVPAGTQSGQRFRLRGRGVPSERAGIRGDLFVEVRLVLPALIDERSKELLREFGRINGENVRKGLGVQETSGRSTP